MNRFYKNIIIFAVAFALSPTIAYTAHIYSSKAQRALEGIITRAGEISLGTTEGQLIIDVTDTEALLIRQNADAGDIFAVDSTNGVVSFGGVAPVTGTRITLPQENDAATPTFAFGDGDTGLYESSDDVLDFARIGALYMTMDTNSLRGRATSNSWYLRFVDPSGTTPIYTFAGDINTGIGEVSAENLSLIAGGLEGGRIEDPADLAATETSLWLYDDDNGTLEQVTVDAADSCSAGFKCLRIVN